MVWGLFPIDSLRGVQKYYIFSQGTYKVGRKGCDIIVQTDTSISRVHAEIVVDKMISLDPLGDMSASSSFSYVRLKDCSKYGSSLNRELEAEVTRLKKDQEVTLKDGDSITFGTGNATFRFVYVPLIFFHMTNSSQQHPMFQARTGVIGAFATTKWTSECTHVLVEKSSSVTIKIVEAVIARKPIVLRDWLEVLAEKSICTEIPCFTPYLPNLSLDGTSVKFVEPKSREKILEQYTFVLGSSTKYKFKNKLQPLLEVAGAKCISTAGFSSSSQTSADEENHQFILVIPSESTNEFSHLQELSSLSRVTDNNLITSVLSGNMDVSIIEQPPYVVSSSHSTDETIVADSDLEMDTAATDHVGTKLKPQVILNDKGEEKVAETIYVRNDMDAATLDCTNIATQCPVAEDKSCEDDIAQGPVKPVNTIRSKEDRSNFLIPTSGISKISGFQSEDFRDMNKTAESDQPHADRYENSDILFSQDLIVRRSNISHPHPVRCSIVNFKCFKKRGTVSGNSFRNLIPFSKDPYNESDFERNGTMDYVREERKRKQMEAIAEDLFNTEKARKRATVGASLDALFARR